MKKLLMLGFAFLLILSMLNSATADVRLPGFFGDHMVLQQDKNIKIWGWADPNEAVDVKLGDQSAKTTAAADGTWKIELAPMKASKEAKTLTVSGNNKIELNDILIGEVWLCSGQSNMEWTVRSSSNAAEEIAAGNHPLIRHIKFAHRPSMTPIDDIQSEWQLCSPETVANFTACGYYMARHLQQELDVPIGLVNSSWGGTRVEPWAPINGFEKVPALHDVYDSVLGRTPGTNEYKTALTDHIAATETWLANAKSTDPGASVAASPEFPNSLKPFTSHQDPTMLYNGMIKAFVGFPIRGAIWYQGESNHSDGMMYSEKKKALINGWRELWGQGEFPFYFVQIAPFNYGNEDPTILATFWEAQAAVTQLPNTGMVVINDIATLDNIHPPNKQDVGKRLALLALKNDYGKTDVVADSPEVDSLNVGEDRLTLSFKNTGGGLKTRDGESVSHFEVIGVGSGGFKPAIAKIEGDTIVLTSTEVAKPTAFRFAWHKQAQPNLCGGTGLPVGAVRGEEIPKFSDNISGLSKYKLVYDLDLSQLKPEIEYDVDNSSQVGSFDRIAYLVELDSDRGPQNVFVSVNAFTDDVKKIGIPTAGSGATFQTKVSEMDVFSDVEGIKTGTNIETGNIEFWPHNYGPGNYLKIDGASISQFDFGDQLSEPVNGYGSMQIHNFGAKQTIFAINHWNASAQADIGIGNNKVGHPDWTFSKSANSYSTKRLRVYVCEN